MISMAYLNSKIHFSNEAMLELSVTKLEFGYTKLCPT